LGEDGNKKVEKYCFWATNGIMRANYKAILSRGIYILKPRQQSEAKASPILTKKRLVVTGIVILFLGIIGLWTLHGTHNDAKDVGAPIDKELIANGAVNICGARDGDPGYGPDNYVPVYGTTYSTNLSYDKAVALVEKVAGNHGFKIKQAKPGDLPFADVSNMYFDHSTVISKRPWANEGPVQLTFTVLDNGTKISCSTKGPTVTSDKSHATIELQILLPRNNW
jgi:hypothetical protein